MNEGVTQAEYLSDLLMLASLAILFVIFLSLSKQQFQRDKLRKRINQQLFRGQAYPVQNSAIKALFEHMAQKLDILLPKAGKERMTAEEQLRYAGFRSPSALTVYYSLRLLAVLVLPGIVFFSAHTLGLTPEVKVMFYTMLAFLGGLMASSQGLQHLAAKRQNILKNALPDALDLLVVCTEAGLGLNAALIRMVREIRQIHPELSLEFSSVTSEIQGGLDRESALNNMIQRTGLNEMKSLVMVINQTMKLGTSVADTLRVYSDEWRDQRMQAAEEKAAKVSTKMIFPLVFCFLPCFFIVSVGPSAIRLIEVFHQ